MTLWKRPWCWERLKAEGEEGDRGWDSWMASPIQRTGTWANSGRRWGTGRPGVLQSMVSEKVRHNVATEQQEEEARGARFPAINTSCLGLLAAHCLWSQELVLVFQLLSLLTASISVFSPEWISRRKQDFPDQCNIPMYGLMHPPVPLNRPKNITVFGPLRNIRK